MRYYFAIVGVLMLAGSAWMYFRRAALFFDGVAVEGRIAGFEARTVDDSLTYFPVVSFHDQRGQQHRFTATAGGSDPRPAVGTVVVVRYRNGDPGTACIQSFLHLWAAPLALATLGSAALLAVVL